MRRRAIIPFLCAAALTLAAVPGLARVGVVVGIAPPAPVVEPVPAPPGAPAMSGSQATGAGPRTVCLGARCIRRGPLRSRDMGSRSLDQAWPRLGTARRGWSRPLIRRGADARLVLAGVLGVGAGEIRVRDRAE
jgi:hypothetical protein